jgi:hypothetical protein
LWEWVGRVLGYMGCLGRDRIFLARSLYKNGLEDWFFTEILIIHFDSSSMARFRSDVR